MARWKSSGAAAAWTACRCPGCGAGAHARCVRTSGRARPAIRDLHMLSDREREATAEVVDVIPVGRYAIQIRWGDGHDTGIYTYDSLRRMGEE